MNMRNILTLALLGAAVAGTAGCRVICQALTPEGRDPQAERKMDGTWCALGTSITWYDVNVDKSGGRLTCGYPTYVMRKLKFDGYVNRAVNGGCVADQLGKVAKADYYTIEHGINDWGHSTPVGTIDDYRNDTRNGTFFATYRRLVDEIRALNPEATIIVCTPRKAYGFHGYLPEHWYLPKNGIKLEQYAVAVREIAAEEGFAVADFFKNSAWNENQLRYLSIDDALHPNDMGHAVLGNETLRAFANVD